MNKTYRLTYNFTFQRHLSIHCTHLGQAEFKAVQPVRSLIAMRAPFPSNGISVTYVLFEVFAYKIDTYVFVIYGGILRDGII